MPAPTRRDPLPRQPVGLDWPTTAWSRTDPGPDVDSRLLHQALDRALPSEPETAQDLDAELDLTLAVAIAHRGRVVAERYGPTAGPDEPLISWSMAKSVVHLWCGLLVADGLLDIDAPAAVAEWAGDERSRITMGHLLTMTSGLEFCEDYVDDETSHVIEMLFGDGNQDVAAYARSMPLIHEPGTRFNYSSGTTNIIARLCGDLIGDQASVAGYLQERLFAPLGMTSADLRFDPAGTFIGSSFLYCTTLDFLRIGYLALRDGVWGGRRLLPAGWIDQARTPVSVEVDEDFWYGAHWWLWGDRTGAFGAHGYEGQYTIVVPARDLVVVRLGKTPSDRKAAVTEWIGDMIDCFPEAP